MALRNGFKCRCADDGTAYDMHGSAPESDCDVACSGDASQICGGPVRNAAFDLWGKKCCNTTYVFTDT